MASGKLWIRLIPSVTLALGVMIDRAAQPLGVPSLVSVVIAWSLATWASGFAFGVMLAVIARLGLNHAQPFAALGVPAFKHFVRLRVARDGREIEAFVVGAVDPLGAAPPVLVDRFAWRP